MSARHTARRQGGRSARAPGRPVTRPRTQFPSLAMRAMELNGLGLGGQHLAPVGERRLRFRFELAASRFGRIYTCELRMKPGRCYPEMFVLKPDLLALAKGKALPHVYSSKPGGVKLCLWLPKRKEWNHRMALGDTYIAWTAEWLWYFEMWLATGRWEGGGEHPPPGKEKRWKRQAPQPSSG